MQTHVWMTSVAHPTAHAHPRQTRDAGMMGATVVHGAARRVRRGMGMQHGIGGQRCEGRKRSRGSRGARTRHEKRRRWHAASRRFVG
jgi:hypothetical protein